VYLKDCFLTPSPFGAANYMEHIFRPRHDADYLQFTCRCLRTSQLNSTRLDSILFCFCLVVVFCLSLSNKKFAKKCQTSDGLLSDRHDELSPPPRRNGHASKLFASAPFIVLRWSKHCPLLSIWVTTWAFPIWIPIVDRFQDLGDWSHSHR